MQVAISFVAGKNLSLDGVLQIPHELPPPYPGVVLCHPHPVLGGSMDVELIRFTASALERAGTASLRFNYRGVGESQGMFTMGKQEAADVQAAVRLLAGWQGLDGRRIGVMGYSFGATMALRAADRRVKGLALVSPPTNGFPVDIFNAFKKPRLLLAGDRDLLADVKVLHSIAQDAGPNVLWQPLVGTDHGLGGRTNEVADMVVEFFRSIFWKK